MWPNTGDYPFLDGVHYWPSDEIQEPSVENFIKAFQQKGYECCDDGDFEEDYQKIALYAKPENWNICTHAARQKRDGTWTSKLGRDCDIQHGTAYSIENKGYGKVRCFMKRLIIQMNMALVIRRAKAQAIFLCFLCDINFFALRTQKKSVPCNLES